MKSEIKYELWKNSVIEAARALHKAAHGVGVTGIRALDTYNEAHHKLWEVMAREPKL
jgi:hypothetical protein